ncbi:MAG: STAS domain-containing protein [Rubrivivax sp.]|nr:STAS domain-containing protein [Rubrivivax sp.]
MTVQHEPTQAPPGEHPIPPGHTTTTTDTPDKPWHAWLRHVHPFRPRALQLRQGYTQQRFWADVGAGITVGIVALPLAMAFAIASGVKPEAGLVTAIVAGFLIAALGGSNVQIGGPAGAFIVIIYGIVERYGLANLLIATSLAGVLLFLMGWLKLGELIRYIPVPIVVGFTNGIAVLIALSQIKDLLGLSIDKLPADFLTQIGVLGRALPTLNPVALALGLGALAVVAIWPRMWVRPGHGTEAAVTKPSRGPSIMARVPSTIVALVGATLLTWALALPVDTIGSRFGGIPSSLPPLALPDFSWQTAKQLVMPTITIALLGAIESLLCARVADKLSSTPRHDPNQELMAQGVANLVTPFFGGIPATGTIARTVTNVRAGATSPVAGVVHAVTLLLVMLLAAPLALHVPLAALSGILLFVAWNMGEWREFAHARRFSLYYRTILFGTFALTVLFDLTVAVEIGLLLACVFFIWRMGTLFSVRDHRQALPDGVQAFELYGALFFGAVGQIDKLGQRVRPATRSVVLEAHQLVSMDTSGLEALRQLHSELKAKGVQLILADLNAQPLSLIQRSGFEAELGADNILPSLATWAELERDARPGRPAAGT